LKLILSVDALSPSLSGIGRYTWELTRRIGQVPGIEQVRFFRNGHWVRNPESLIATGATVQKRRFKFPRWAERRYWEWTCRGHVFHSPNYFLPPYAENGVATIHDLSVFKFPETHPVERVRQFEKLFRKTLDISVHLITDTEATRVEVTAVHLGVASAFLPQTGEMLASRLKHFGLSPEGYALCVSTIEPRKRVNALLAAYGALPAELRVCYPLVLAGGYGWRSESIHKLIEIGQRAGWLRYLGFVPEADLPALYAGARLFAYPSIYEGFGLPVAEAMASGVPVVTSDRSCLPEVAGGAARLVNPDDVDAFAAALEAGLTDITWRQNAIKRGLQVVARYDWAKCAEQTATVYAESVATYCK
jgi:alpha-1,3-rhamnosyl/mannosyltransferase